MRAIERHEDRFRGTSVGSEPLKPEPDHSYNRSILDLLHAMRFHPSPLVSVNRPESSVETDDHASHATIPYSDVQGPISMNIETNAPQNRRRREAFLCSDRKDMALVGLKADGISVDAAEA